MKKLFINLGEKSYTVTVGGGLLSQCDKHLNLNRRVLVVTDSGVPKEYARTVAALCKESKILTVDEGEGSKSFDGLQKVLSAMKDMGLGRGDCAVAVGGGVVGDLTGFAAACYMRGIDFYNVPTTLLSEVDSSIGGKCAINFEGVKNNIGAFHQPKGVLIDTDTLKTLPKRQIVNGLVEAIKMSLTSDAALFEKFENMTYEEILENIEDIIVASLSIKRDVVEKDERESGLRKILNFGHTFGHGVEAVYGMPGLYHGECVAIGMIPMCDPSVRERLVRVLQRLGLVTEIPMEIEKMMSFVAHDKKASGKKIDCIYVKNVGECEIVPMTTDELEKLVREVAN